MEYPELPWNERDLKIVELLENEKLIRKFTIKLAECTHEEDTHCPVFGSLRKRGAKHFASSIKVLKFRNEILRDELEEMK